MTRNFYPGKNKTMKTRFDRTYVAFVNGKALGRGDVFEVAKKARRLLDKEPRAQILVFDDVDSSLAELDLRGDEAKVIARLKTQQADDAPKTAGPGRPKLGVVAKEITLLPRHWDWLSAQPGGASGTLRRLIDEAQKKNRPQDAIREAQESTYKFMTAMAGDLPLYEEALRALYAKNKELFTTLTDPWPKDIRDHVRGLSKAAF